MIQEHILSRSVVLEMHVSSGEHCVCSTSDYHPRNSFACVEFWRLMSRLGTGGGPRVGTGGGTGTQCKDAGEGKCTATPAAVRACNGCATKQNTNVVAHNHYEGERRSDPLTTGDAWHHLNTPIVVTFRNPLKNCAVVSDITCWTVLFSVCSCVSRKKIEKVHGWNNR